MCVCIVHIQIAALSLLTNISSLATARTRVHYGAAFSEWPTESFTRFLYVRGGKPTHSRLAAAVVLSFLLSLSTTVPQKTCQLFPFLHDASQRYQALSILHSQEHVSTYLHALICSNSMQCHCFQDSYLINMKLWNLMEEF